MLNIEVNVGPHLLEGEEFSRCQKWMGWEMRGNSSLCLSILFHLFPSEYIKIKSSKIKSVSFLPNAMSFSIKTFSLEELKALYDTICQVLWCHEVLQGFYSSSYGFRRPSVLWTAFKIFLGCFAMLFDAWVPQSLFIELWTLVLHHFHSNCMD